MIEASQHNQMGAYFADNIRPVFSELMHSITKSRPEDIVDFSIKHFKDKKNINDSNQANNSESDDDDDCVFKMKFVSIPDEQFIKYRQDKLLKARSRRIGLSSQAYGKHGNRVSLSIPKGFKKQENPHINILFFCMNSFLFRHFTQGQVNYLINIMGQRNTVRNQIVFEEGEQGNHVYFVYQGIYQCFKQGATNDSVLNYYHKGDSFGQICLLHVIKRQASIRSQGNGVLYTLDRQSYTHFKKMCISKMRTLYLYTLKNQALFSTFQEEELQKICDILTQITYEEGQTVINEGDVGKRFYIIIEGILVAFKGRQQNIVQCYKEGDAFGQISLIRQIPRQASVKALTRCRLVYLSQIAFSRIFLNVDLEKQIEQKYGKNSGFITNKRRQ